jgi:large subunit ribosomal protein L13
MNMNLVIDAKDASLGRLASTAAKQALLGKNVTILNCTETIIFGNKVSILESYKRTFFRRGGSMKLAKHIKRSPERIVKRTIRGMLSHKQTRGQNAFKKIMCYDAVPKEFKEAENMMTFKKSTKKGLVLKDLARLV